MKHWRKCFHVLMYPTKGQVASQTAVVAAGPSTAAYASPQLSPTTTALIQWIKTLSWDFCPSCSSLYTLPMLCSFENPYKSSKKQPQCPCFTGKYIVPSPHNIPHPLAKLQWEDNYILSPFAIDCGRLEVKEHGYCQKTGLINLKWSSEAVIDKINNVIDDNQHLRCSNA